MADARMPVPRDFREDLRLDLERSAEAKFAGRAPATADFISYFNQGLSGVLYRFAACADRDEEFTANFGQHGDSPPFPERYYQERSLFEFFVNGQSAIECLCFAFHALGAMANPAGFPMTTDDQLRVVSPERSRDRFAAHFARDRLSAMLNDLVSSTEYRAWKATRNQLMHRVHPGRVFNLVVGGVAPSSTTTWTDVTIERDTTTRRRTWLSGQLAPILEEACRFTDGLP